MINKFQAAALALGRIEGLSNDERAAVVELLKVGRGHVPVAAEGAVTALTVLSDRAFRWPEFDRWQTFFAARGTFPGRWDGLHAVPGPETAPAARAAYQRRKLDLLLEWLDTLTRGAGALVHYTRQGMQARIVLQGDGQRCPACESFNGLEVRPGTLPVPPIHPGCRCVLMAMTAAPPDERLGPNGRHRLGAAW